MGTTVYAATDGGLSFCSAVGCTVPVVSISPASQTITSGGSVTLTASGATSYAWSNGSTANPLIVSNVTSATTLSVTGTTGGCSGTASASVSVTAAGNGLFATSPGTLDLNTVTCPGSTSFLGSGVRFTVTGPNGFLSNFAFRSLGVTNQRIVVPLIKKAGTYTITVYGATGQTPFTTTFNVLNNCP